MLLIPFLHTNSFVVYLEYELYQTSGNWFATIANILTLICWRDASINMFLRVLFITHQLTLAISIDEANAKLFSYPETRINCPDMFSTDPCVSTFHWTIIPTPSSDAGVSFHIAHLYIKAPLHKMLAHLSLILLTITLLKT